MIRGLNQVVRIEDLPKHSLKAGDIGTVVLVHRSAEQPSVADAYANSEHHIYSAQPATG